MAKSIAGIFLLTILSMLTSACTATYPVVGSFDEYNEVFKGQVHSNLLKGESFIEVSNENSGIKCSGRSRTLHIPASNHIAGLFGIPYCEGQKGDAYLICDDNRRIRATWTAESCTTGYGSGADQYGARFQFAFGMTEEEAEKRFRTELAAAKDREEFPNYRPEARERAGFSTGTGFLVSEDGYVVTNFHVVDEASQIWVVTDGQRHAAKLVSRDPANDMAVLKAEIRGAPVPIASGTDVVVGERVMTLGYPLISIQGQALKATFGHVNALSGIEDDPRFIQIDVPVQPGNSGGPLINARGELIAIVTMTLDQLVTLQQSGTLAQNVNYAVKAYYLLPLLKGIKTRTGSGQKQEFRDMIDTFRSSVFLIIAK